MKLKKYISDYPIVIIIITFVTLYLWQPFFGGLYSDDWGFLLSYFTENDTVSAPFAFDRLVHFMKVYANRPISGIMFYIFNSIAGYNLFLIHLLMLIPIYLSAFSIYKLGSSFFRFLRINNSYFYGSLLATIWLISPWTLGVTVWYSSSINLISLILFSFSIYYVFKSYETENNYFIISGLLYFASCLTYESYFFQYSSFLLVIWIYSNDNSNFRKKVIKFFILFSSILVITIIWNRMSANLFESSIHKALNPYFFQTLAINLVSFPYIIFKGFGELFLPATIITLPVTVYLVLKLKKNYGSIKELIFNKNMKVILVLGLGILLSVLMYSAAGYTLWTLGSRSRTMFVTSFYLPFILIIFWKWVTDLSIMGRSYRIIFLSIIGTITIASFALNKFDWIEADNIQEQVTTSVPKEIASMSKETMVIFVGPYRHNWISVIDAPWAINFQMKYGNTIYNHNNLEPFTEANFVSGTGVVHPAKNKNYQLYWDGDSLTIGYNLQNIAYKSGAHIFYDKMEKFEAKKLYVWDYKTQSVIEITEPQLFEFTPYKNYDYWVTWLYHKWKNN